jgi:hypothetical protein
MSKYGNASQENVKVAAPDANQKATTTASDNAHQMLALYHNFEFLWEEHEDQDLNVMEYMVAWTDPEIPAFHYIRHGHNALPPLYERFPSDSLLCGGDNNPIHVQARNMGNGKLIAAAIYVRFAGGMEALGWNEDLSIDSRREALLQAYRKAA